jgi:hypothetical protein
MKFVEHVSKFLLQVHCYRAVLEKILVKYWPHLRRTAVKSIKHSNNMTFSE